MTSVGTPAKAPGGAVLSIASMARSERSSTDGVQRRIDLADAVLRLNGRFPGGKMAFADEIGCRETVGQMRVFDECVHVRLLGVSGSRAGWGRPARARLNRSFQWVGACRLAPPVSRTTTQAAATTSITAAQALIAAPRPIGMPPKLWAIPMMISGLANWPR